MARKKVEVLVSDLSGAQIPVGTGAVVTVVFNDGRAKVKVDVTDTEVAALLGGKKAPARAAAPGKRRGRSWTPEQRAEQAAKAKERWARRKAQGSATSPAA